MASSTTEASWGTVYGREDKDLAEWAEASEAEAVLREAVEWSLERGLYGNATWLAERLLAMSDPCNQTALGLLATCHLRAGRPARAHALLFPHLPSSSSSSSASSSSSSASGSSVMSGRNRYLFAQAAFLLGRMKEAHDALLPHPSATPPHGPAGCYLLGQVLRHMNQRPRAIEYLRRSLEQQPYMWSAYEALCALGEDVDAASFFHASHPSCTIERPEPATASHVPMPALTPTPSVPKDHDQMKTPVTLRPPSLIMPSHTPSSARLPSTPHQESTFVKPNLPPMPAKKKADAHRARLVPRKSTRLSFSSATDEDTGSTPNTKRKPEATQKPAQPGIGAKRRVSKPSSHQAKDAEERSLSAFEDLPTFSKLSLQGQKGPADETPLDANQMTSALQASSRAVAEQTVLELLQTMGNAYRHLCQLRCRDAMNTFELLPERHYNTAWVLAQVARAHFEMVNYTEAERLFAKVHRMDGARTADMEIYSTILWHLRKEVELSHLAQQLIDTDKMSPQAWCALGNCFSLQKEHQTAIKFFQRATQVDARFAYAYTLCGHEHVASDDLEKALSCFRSALRIDPRHYNAWFGLGLVYYRQERYDFAEYHFRRALSINHTSSILKCYIGMVLYANDRPQEALGVLEDAIRMDPSNGLAKYKKACVLFALGHYDQVIADLLALQESAPKEATLYCLLGKAHTTCPHIASAYKRQGNEEAALRCFHTALDMDAKNQPYIKGLIDRLHTPDDPSLEDPLPDLP